MTEEWRPVEGFDGYEVSDQGRVRSYLTRGAHGGFDSEPRILSPSLSTNGYWRISLRKQDSKRRMYFTIHRLVAKAFVDGYQDGLIVCHNDSNRTNNVPSNLRWDTISSNAIDASRLGDLPRQRLNESQVREIRSLYEAGGHSHRTLSEMFDVTHQTIRALIIRKNYRWVA